MIRAPISTHSSATWFDAGHSVLWLSSAAAVLAAGCLVVFALQVMNRPAAVTATVAVRSQLDAYMDLRRRISDTMGPLHVPSQPVDILARERALGAAMKAARPEARPGVVFTAAATEDVRRAIAADWMRRSVSDRMALMSEVPPGLPRVNEPYPNASPLATVPALLLDALPRLPDDFEYRFMGRALIVRDVESNLIVDVLPDAITRSGRSER